MILPYEPNLPWKRYGTYTRDENQLVYEPVTEYMILSRKQALGLGFSAKLNHKGAFPN